MKLNFRMIKPFLQKHGPSILTGLSMLGVVATGYLTHRADRKIIGDACEAILFEDDADIPVDVTVGRVMRKHWKNYILPASVGVATMACSLGANQWHLSKEGALTAAALMYKTSGEELEKALKEKFGEEEVAEVKKKIAEAKDDKERPPWEAKHPDKMKIWEPYSKQWFWASQQQLLWAEIMINKMICQQWKVSLNDLLNIYGLRGKKEFDDIGWSYDDECYTQTWACGGRMMGNWIGFSPILKTGTDGEEYFEMDYEVHPNDITEVRDHY